MVAPGTSISRNFSKCSFSCWTASRETSRFATADMDSEPRLNDSALSLSRSFARSLSCSSRRDPMRSIASFSSIASRYATCSSRVFFDLSIIAASCLKSILAPACSASVVDIQTNGWSGELKVTFSGTSASADILVAGSPPEWYTA